jgi:aminopeptidase N
MRGTSSVGRPPERSARRGGGTGVRPALVAIAIAVASAGASPADSAVGGGDTGSLIRSVVHRVEAARWAAPRAVSGPPRAQDYDVLHYEIDLTPTFGPNTLTGTVDITIESKIAGLSSVLLHLHALSVTSASIGGTAVAVSHVGDELTVTLDRPYGIGEVFVLRIGYGGTPQHESFGGFWFYTDMAFSMGVGLYTDPPSMGRYWFPCFDEPHDKATVEGRYTAPAGMSAVGNGLLTETIPGGGGSTTFVWEDGHPTSTYLIATAIADWAVVEDPVDPARIYHYVLPADSIRAVTSFQNVSTMMEAFETTYGPYVWDKASFVGVRKGDMEHSTCVAHLRTLINGDNSWDPILAHELSHHWWGDWVTVADWRDVWLSEGFATYSEAIYQGYIEGSAGYHASINDIMDYYLASGETFPIYDPVELWGATSYEKGASVLHMLRHVVGDADFFGILDEWGTAYGFANAVTTDFIAVAEAVSGEDLDWFFGEWVFDGGYPEYEWSWSATPVAAEYLVEIDVSQVQSVGPVFRMPIDFVVTTAGGDETHTEIVDQASQTVSFTVSEQPLDVAFDPDRWVLGRKNEISTGVGEIDAPAALMLGPAAPNPFSPSTSLRLVVRDGALPVRVGVYDGAGRLMRTLLDGVVAEGTRVLEWDGHDDGGRTLGDGVYFMRAEQGERREVKRVILLK